MGHLQHQAGEIIQLPSTENKCTKLLQQAQKELREFVTNDRKLWQEDQEARTSLLFEEPTSKKKAQMIRQIKRAEEIKAMYKKIRNMRRPHKQGVSRVQVPQDSNQLPKECTEWRTIDTPSEVKQALLHRNQQHFGQAQGTPFTIPPLSEHIDFSASTHYADLILSGEYPTENLDAATALLVKHLQQTSLNHNAVTDQVTDSDFVGKMKTWKESTSTSPSGYHLGHWKALCA